MSEEDLNTYKKYVSDLDITKYVVLDSESNYWYSAEYVDEMLKKQDKEIERLNNQIKEYGDLDNHNKYLYKENKRLNNIINDLETYIIENSFGSPANNCSVIETYKILDKLQELKGSDKE